MLIKIKVIAKVESYFIEIRLSILSNLYFKKVARRWFTIKSEKERFTLKIYINGRQRHPMNRDPLWIYDVREKEVCFIKLPWNLDDCNGRQYFRSRITLFRLSTDMKRIIEFRI